MSEPTKTKNCLQCGTSFVQDGEDHVYCSDYPVRSTRTNRVGIGGEMIRKQIPCWFEIDDLQRSRTKVYGGWPDSVEREKIEVTVLRNKGMPELVYYTFESVDDVLAKFTREYEKDEQP